MDSLPAEAVIRAIENAPAIGVLVWLVYRADARAQRCIEKVFRLINGHGDK
jgi:hypothetical protein